MVYKEKTIKSDVVFKGKMISLRVDTVNLPENKLATREIVDHPGAVAIVPITNEEKIIMVKQYRKPIEDFLLEIPAGKLEYNESPILCAHRELHEETGFIANRLEHMLTIFTSPGFSNEKIEIFIAKDLTEGEAKPDEDEYLLVESYSLPELIRMIFDGSIKDSKTITGILVAQEYLSRYNNMDK